MKIVITGSLGHISKPLTNELVQNGHTVIVVSSRAEKQKDIEAVGATAAIGSLEDVNFLIRTFTGADAVYTMIPPNNYFDHTLDLDAYYRRLGQYYAQAIDRSGVSRQVHLSSIGAHLEKGNGILSSTYVVEHILRRTKHVAITFIRPTSFYYNLLGYIPGIQSEGVILANYGTESVIPWVSPIDIARVVAQELTGSTGGNVRYVASEELTGADTARILGAAIGKPNLQWNLISDGEALRRLVSIGMNPRIAGGLIEMYAALQSGLLAEDYHRNKPETMGQVKLTDYAKEFASVYNSWRLQRENDGR